MVSADDFVWLRCNVYRDSFRANARSGVCCSIPAWYLRGRRNAWMRLLPLTMVQKVGIDLSSWAVVVHGPSRGSFRWHDRFGYPELELRRFLRWLANVSKQPVCCKSLNNSQKDLCDRRHRHHVPFCRGLFHTD